LKFITRDVQLASTAIEAADTATETTLRHRDIWSTFRCLGRRRHRFLFGCPRANRSSCLVESSL
jgi:hypothetical protein